MKVLFFTDTHSDKNMIEKVKGKSKNADIIVCLGDLTTFQVYMKTILRELSGIGKQVLIIHGNHEGKESLESATEKMKNIKFLHKEIYETENFIMFGYGGGGFSSEDRDFEKISKKWERLINEKKEKKTILLTHGPPYGCGIDLIGKHHVGNKSYTKFLKKNNIDFVFSGHLHENFYKTGKIGKTTFLNPGPEGRIIDI